jgi:hypothetical protein
MDETPERSGATRGLTLAVVVAGVGIAGAGVWWWTRPAPAPPARSEAPAPAAPVARERPGAPEVAAPATPPAVDTGRRRERPREKPPVAVEPTPSAVPVAGPVLIVESDVAGASVFPNRKYLGTTPLRSTDVTPGAGQLNASAEGYDGVVQTVQIADSGTTEVTIRFKEVRLNESVAVVHKHGMGSCDGTLKATVGGLRYETTNKGDAFTLPFPDLEVFEIDYLQKALKVKKRGGRTWNFTTKAETADPLFVFHRDVDKARKRLAP